MSEIATSASDARSANFPIVGIGASAGGLEAVAELMSAVPAESGMAFLVVQHLDATRHSLLPDILAKRILVPVQEAVDGLVIEVNNLYTIPANTRMFVVERKIRLRPRDEALSPPMPIDDLLESLAADQGANAIGVILSGSGSDGALGLQALQTEGGITFAQDASAQFSSMPRAAIALGCVDRVLPPPEIAKEIMRIGRRPHLRAAPDHKDEFVGPVAASLPPIFALLQSACKIDFTRYKLGTIQRRLSRRMALRQLTSVADYVAVLESEPAETLALGRDLLIHVTEFFRDPDTFEALIHTVFPRLIGDRDATTALRIWVPGCATGEEVYSIAICLLEYLERHSKIASVQIFGTDISAAALEKARAGRYIENIARNVSAERLKRFFVRDGEYFYVAKAVRDLCTFARHDVVSDPPFSRMNLISCRNLLIYLSAPAQRNVMPLFHYALKPEGVLMLGPSETVGAFSELFGVVDNKRSKLYSKKPRLSAHTEMRLSPVLVPSIVARPRAVTAVQQAPDDASLLRAEVDRVSLARYAPASVLCDEELNVIEYRGDTSNFLVNPSGPPSTNLQRLAKPELLATLNEAVRQARQDGVVVRKTGHQSASGIASLSASLEVHPIRIPKIEGNWFLIFFEETSRQTRGMSTPKEDTLRTLLLQTMRLRLSRKMAERDQDPRDEEIKRLNGEVVAMRAQLRTMLEEHESAREELKSSEEELMSSNEEFQSTNEELEAAKEELQSLNEELSTTNEELRYRNHELKTMHDEVVTARDYAEAIINTMSEPLLVLEPDLRVTRANRAFYDTFKTSAEKTVGLMLYSLGNRQWDIASLRELLDNVLPQKSVVLNFQITHTFEEIGERTMRLNAARVTGPMHELIVLTIEDITHHQLLVDKLKTANRQKDDFLAMLAHELRNPLTAISNGLEIWERETVDAETVRRARETAKRQLKLETGLIDDLLDMSRITRGLVKIRSERVNLAEVVQHAVAAMQSESDARQHVMSLLVPATPVMVEGDSMRLEQVVTNLLANAIKYTPPGGHIDVSVRSDGDQIIVMVRDNGIGIAPDFLPEIFAIFVQAERMPERKSAGLGLGLALVHHLVSMHRGTVRASSDGLGFGSTFVVCLPTLIDLNPGDLASTNLPTTTQPVVPRRILVVDDNVDTAESTKALLCLDGHDVETASTGSSALSQASAFRPEVVLLDISLPDMDGFEVARRFRATSELTHIVLIAHSGYAGEDHIKRVKEAGFNHHLVKPASIKQFNEVLALLPN